MERKREPCEDELVDCPVCNSPDVIWIAPLDSCPACGGKKKVTRESLERCFHPGCTEPAVKPGLLCKNHGCIQCGEVILADYEDERLCEECGNKIVGRAAPN